MLFSCKPKPINNNVNQVADFCLEEFPLDMTEDRSPDDPPEKAQYLIIHCTATLPSVHWTKEDILRFFKEDRQWSRPGYRDFIDKDGVLHNLRPYDNDGYIQYEEATWGARGYNWISWHIAYDGGVDQLLKGADTRNDAQIKALRNYVTVIKTMFPEIKIMGHRDLPGVNKACPSFDVHSDFEESLVDLNDMFDMSVDSLD